MTIDRRSLLTAASGLSAWALAGPVAPAFAQGAGALTPVQFAQMSAVLTGYPTVDAGDAALMLRAFATPQRRAALATLAKVVAATPAAELDAALKAQKLEGIANDLVAAWYSGVVTSGTQQQVVFYTSAFVWSAMTYSKPMGICGGVTGYWANPPA